MSRIGSAVFSLAVAAAWYLASPEAAAAYVGPGAGLTVIGAALAFLASVVLAVVGFVWYPIKRFLRGRRDQSVAPD